VEEALAQNIIFDQTQEQEIRHMTANEQKILDAASALVAIKDEIVTGVEARDTKIREQAAQIADLMNQLGQIPPPEDLSQELGSLDESLGSLKTLADGLVPAPAGTPATPADGDTGTGDAIPAPAPEVPGTAGDMGSTTDHPGDPAPPAEPAPAEDTGDATPVADSTDTPVDPAAPVDGTVVDDEED